MTAPMGNEQQRVDVLAVMDGRIESLVRLQEDAISEGNHHLANELEDDDGELTQFRRARAAVAELIESTAAEYAAQAAYDNAATGKQRNETWDAVLDARKRRITAFLNAGGSAA